MGEYNSTAGVKQERREIIREGAFLSDYSPDDRPWDTHRQETDEVIRTLATVDNDRIASMVDRLRQCAPWLIFSHSHDSERPFRLSQASFCRVRVCPVCQWRRSMRYTAKMLKAIPGILEANHTLRLVHLTLTVRNCSIEELRATIKEMNTAWKRLIQRRVLKRVVRGYVRATEVTFNPETREAHPHFHSLLLVPESYFKHKAYYIKHDEWIALWRDCARLDYDPSVRVQAVRKADPGRIAGIIRELTKYTTKVDSLVQAGPEWLAEYIYQTTDLRFWATGGIVRETLSEVEQDYKEDLINTDDETEAEGLVYAQSMFDWTREAGRYRHRETRYRPAVEPVPNDSETNVCPSV